jgi:hypothetical protein
MSWLTTIAIYGAAYMFLSVCVGLVVGRMFRTTGWTELDAPTASTATIWRGQTEPTGAALVELL